jgi:hypothetical protein
MEKYLVPLSQKISSQASSEAWSQVFQVIPSSDEEKKNRGFLFAVVDLKAPKGFDTEAAGKLVLSTLKEEYYGHFGGGVLGSLEEAVEVSRKRLVDLATSSPVGSLGIDFNLVAVVLWGAVAYMAKLGESYFGVYRQGRLHLIDQSSPDSVKTASGLLEENDCLFLVNGAFKETLSQSRSVEAILAEESMEEVGEKFANLLKDQRGLVGLVVRLGVEKVTEKEGKVVFTYDSSDVDVSPMIKRPSSDRVKILFTNLKTSYLRVRKSFAETDNFFRKKEVFSSPLLKKWKNRFSHWLAESPLTGLLPRQGLGRLGRFVFSTRLKKHRVLLLTLVLGLILAGSVAWTLREQNLAEKKKKFESLMSLAQSKYEEAVLLRTLNPLRAKSLLEDVKLSLGKAKELKVDDQRAETLESLAAQVFTQGRQAHQISDPPLVYDLSDFHPRAKGDGLSLTGQKLAVLSKDPPALYSLDFSSKEAKVLTESSSTLPQPFFLTSYEQYLYIFSGSSGLIRYNLNTNSAYPIVDFSSEWQNIVDLEAYHKNLYLLDTGGNAIWKYLPTDDGYSAGRNYFSDKEKVDLSKAVSLAIDGSIWVLTSDGGLFKFNQGQREDFRVAGLEGNFKNPTKIYTGENLANLYILDKGNQRVVVISKSGNFVGQYVSEKFSSAADLAADETRQKLFVVAGPKVYSVDLRYE